MKLKQTFAAAAFALMGISMSTPALAYIGNGQSYFVDSKPGTVTLACDSINPPDPFSNAGISTYYYIGANSSGSGEVQTGIRKGRTSLSVWFADHYFQYTDGSGIHYQKIDNVTEANNTALSYRIDAGGSGAAGYWKGTVTVGGVNHPSSLYYTGYSTVNTVFTEVQTVGCGSGSGATIPFSNFWDFTTSWVRLTTASAPNNGLSYSCSSTAPIMSITNTGTINNGSTGTCRLN